MPLIAIPNQPYFQQRRPTDCFAICDDREYLMPVIAGDPIMMQFKQTPCEQSIVCDGDFSALEETTEAICDTEFDDVGSEELVNGAFTGNANGWTLGNNWSYAANAVTKTAGQQGVITQMLPNAINNPNGIYKLEFDISGNGGSVGVTPYLQGGGTINSQQCFDDGHYKLYIKITDNFIYTTFGFNGDTAWSGTIDNVSLKEVAPCWTFDGFAAEGWSIENGTGYAMTYHLNNTQIYGEAGDSLICFSLNQNTNYDVTIEIEDGSGTVAFDVGAYGSIYYTLTGGAQTINFQANSGAGNSFIVIPGSNSKMKISSISAEEVSGECWDYEADEFLNAGNSLCHVPGATGSVLTNTPTIQPGYYQLKFKITGRTAGFINAGIAGVQVNYAQGLTANQNYVFYLKTTVAGQLQFTMSALFDGCISDVEIFTLHDDFPFSIVDKDGNVVGDISDFAYYADDYVTLKFTMEDIEALVESAVPLYGCYYVKVYNLCEIQYEEIVCDTEFQNPKNIYWVQTAGGLQGIVTDITGGELIVDCSAFVAANDEVQLNNHCTPYSYPQEDFYEQQPSKIPDGPHNYRIEFDITQNDDPTNIIVNVLGGNQRPIPHPFAASPVGSYSVDISYDPLTTLTPVTLEPAHWFAIIIDLRNATRGIVKISNVSIRRIEPYDQTYTSVGIKYAANYECTKYIQAYCDNDNLGFKFAGAFPTAPSEKFKIAMRINMEAPNPSYPEETDDYLFSEGTKQRNFGQSEKTYTLQTGNLPEWCHDAIAKMRASQHFQIGEPLDEFLEYFCLPGDYSPYTDKRGRFKLTSGRFEIQLKDRDVKFFRNS